MSRLAGVQGGADVMLVTSTAALELEYDVMMIGD